MGQGTRLQNITPPGVLANVGHYGQNLEALREEQEQEQEKRRQSGALPTTSHVLLTTHSSMSHFNI